ncbi:MAG: hypothetical protein HKN16_00365 [Saprospiraceae bacterium]|nr:hypothetical protein [Saprospiraceae bacterium]
MLRMKFLALLISFFLVLAAEGQESWISYSPSNGGFLVEVPDSMEYVPQEMEVPIGTITFHSFFYKSGPQADNSLYQVQYFDYPEHTVSSDSLELVKQLFDENVRSAERSVQGSLLYRHDIDLAGFPGILFKVGFEDGDAAIKSKMFVRNSRFYSISVVGAREKSLNQAVERFLDSFRFVDNGS